MPARIVVVHDDPAYVDELARLLRRDGHDVATFPDPLAAWDALEAAKRTEVLVTRVEFAPGRSNGLALARMARSKRRQIRVLITALPEHALDAGELGTFLPLPVDGAGVAQVVTSLLETN